MDETVIAERKFVIEASQERLWQLIGGVIFDSLPSLERMEIVDENNWSALLKVKLGLITLNMKLTGQMVEVIPPERLGVRLSIRGKGGIVRLSQKVNIAFTPIDEAKSEVACKAVAEGVGTFFKIFLLGQARGFAGSIFDKMEDRLKYLTE